MIEKTWSKLCQRKAEPLRKREITEAIEMRLVVLSDFDGTVTLNDFREVVTSPLLRKKMSERDSQQGESEY